MSLTTQEFLHLAKVLINKWAELSCKDIDDNIRDAKGLLDLYYLRALTSKRIDALLNIHTEYENSNDDRKKIALIDEVFGDELGVPASNLKIDVAQRLEWLKRRKVHDFEDEIKRAINFHNITSPIEHIFLMEWVYGGYSQRLGIELHPQKSIRTDETEYIVDFMVKSVKSDIPQFSIVVELDGHDFHEKTKEQAARDKKRDRILTRMGLPVLRFTGSEISYKTRDCINEIIDFAQSMKGNT